MTAATGSVSAVTVASSGVKNFNPALKAKNAITVPKIIIHAKLNKVPSVTKGNQFKSSISGNVIKPPINIPTLVTKAGSIRNLNKYFGKIAENANAAPLAKLHATQPNGTKIFDGSPPVTNKNTPIIAKITAKISVRVGIFLLYSDCQSTAIAGVAESITVVAAAPPIEIA